MELAAQSLASGPTAEGLHSKARSVGFSYLYRPWSTYRHLEDALRQLVPVQYFGTPARERSGFFPADHLAECFVDPAEAPEFFFATEDTLFSDLPKLPCPTAIWFADYWPGDHHRLRLARLFDHVFAPDRRAEADFKKAGCPSVHWLPFGCDPEIHGDQHRERIYQVGFVGFLNRPEQAGRARLLQQLAERYRMNDFTRPAYLQDMAAIYSQSKIVVNLPNRGGFNMRTFEAMAAGALLLTEDVGIGQDELFTRDQHLVVYRDDAELVRKIEYYLRHEEERQRIATAGQQEVLAHHTYRHRAQTMLEVVRQAGAQRFRTTNAEDILRVYALFHARRGRLDQLIRLLRQSACSWSTRGWLLARLVKCVLNQFQVRLEASR